MRAIFEGYDPHEFRRCLLSVKLKAAVDPNQDRKAEKQNVVMIGGTQLRQTIKLMISKLWSIGIGPIGGQALGEAPLHVLLPIPLLQISMWFKICNFGKIVIEYNI